MWGIHRSLRPELAEGKCLRGCPKGRCGCRARSPHGASAGGGRTGQGGPAGPVGKGRLEPRGRGPDGGGLPRRREQTGPRTRRENWRHRGGTCCPRARRERAWAGGWRTPSGKLRTGASDSARFPHESGTRSAENEGHEGRGWRALVDAPARPEEHPGTETPETRLGCPRQGEAQATSRVPAAVAAPQKGPVTPSPAGRTHTAPALA